MFVLIILSLICNAAPMIILPLVYDVIPDNIPAFVDFWGKTVVSMDKSYLSILRLPLMGLLLTVLCIIMYSLKISGENGRYNKIIWSVVAFISGLKMGLTSMEVLYYENIDIINIFRILVMILVVIGIMVLIFGLIRMYKNKIPLTEYVNGISSNKIKITGIIILYIIVVLMPFYINQI